MTVPTTAATLPASKTPIPRRYEGLPEAATFGRLASRPNAIDGNAVQFFADWIGQCMQTDVNGNVVLRPEFVPIGTQGRLRTPASITPLPKLAIDKVSGDAQTAKAGEPVSQPLKVRVISAGIAAEGLAVVFEIRDFGASIAGARKTSRRTDSNGEVEIGGWVLGPALDQSLVASVGSTQAVFTARTK